MRELLLVVPFCLFGFSAAWAGEPLFPQDSVPKVSSNEHLSKTRFRSRKE